MDPEQLNDIGNISGMLREFSMASLMASLIFGTLGAWVFMKARKMQNVKLIVISMVMMGYSFFTPNAVWNWGVGFVLAAAARHVWHEE